jgi:hypothetical protein
MDHDKPVHCRGRISCRVHRCFSDGACGPPRRTEPSPVGGNQTFVGRSHAAGIQGDHRRVRACVRAQTHHHVQHHGRHHRADAGRRDGGPGHRINPVRLASREGRKNRRRKSGDHRQSRRRHRGPFGHSEAACRIRRRFAARPAGGEDRRLRRSGWRRRRRHPRRR